MINLKNIFLIFLFLSVNAFSYSTSNPSLINCPDKSFNYLITPKTFSTIKSRLKINSPQIYENLPEKIQTTYICNSDKVYYVPDNVSVEKGGALICQPNTTLIFAQGTGIYVSSDGYISSRGTCENRVKFLPEVSTMGYWNGIYLVGGNQFLSPSEIIYTYIQGAITGIYLENISLFEPVRHNVIEYCYWGIFSLGIKHTKITNNAFYFCGDYNYTENGYEIVGAGIESYHTSLNQKEDPNSIVEIEFNTFLENVIGVCVRGVPHEFSAGITRLNHNVYCSSLFYNVALFDGYMHILSENNGYYLNYKNSKNKNWDFPDENSILSIDFPLENLTGINKFYLKNNSAFQNAGKLFIQETDYIGSSCLKNNDMDYGKVDLGFHQYHWTENNYTSTNLWADFDNSGIVDFNDLSIFTSSWLSDGSELVDLDPNKNPDYDHNNTVNIYDLSEFAALWLKTSSSNIEFSVSLDQDGSVNVDVIDAPDNTLRYFLIVDGIFIKEFAVFDFLKTRSFYIPWLSNGLHKAQIVGLLNNKIVSSNVVNFKAKITVGPCYVPSLYAENSSIPFFVSNDSNSILVTAYNYEKEVWKKMYPTGAANDVIPSSAIDANDIDYISFQIVPLLKENSSSDQTIVPCSVFRTNKNDIRALIVLPNFKLNRVNSGLITLYKKMFKERNVPFEVLGASSSSIKNLKKYAKNYRIQYLIINTHGNYIFPGTQTKRTVLELDDGIVVSDKISRNPSASYLNPLPQAVEDTVLTIAEIGFDNLCYVHYDGCYGGRLYIDSKNQLVEGTQGQSGLFSGPHNDLTMALNLYSNKSKFYFGWFSNFIAGYTSDHYQFSCDIISTLTDGKKLDEAILHAINDCRNSSPPDPRNEYRIKGQGNMSDVKIR